MGNTHQELLDPEERGIKRKNNLGTIGIVGCGNIGFSTTMAMQKKLDENPGAILVVSNDELDVFDTRPTFKITNHNALYDKPLKINYIGDNRSSKSKKHNNRKSHKRKKAKNGRQKRRK